MNERLPTDSHAASVEVVTEKLTLSMHEVCQRCGLDSADLQHLLAHGVIEPVPANRDEWLFSADALGLLTRAARMQRDFELDAAGLAMALSLLDELQRSRRQVDRLRQLLAQHVQL